MMTLLFIILLFINGCLFLTISTNSIAYFWKNDTTLEKYFRQIYAQNFGSPLLPHLSELCNM